MKKKKYHKCKECQKISTLITLGDLTIGCADCGSRAGFLEKLGKRGEWKERPITFGEDKLHRFLITGK